MPEVGRLRSWLRQARESLPLVEAAAQLCLLGGRDGGQRLDGACQEIGSDGLDGAAKAHLGDLRGR